ncbi:2-dehydro-3-deoxygalactonokinase [Hoeflea sp. TYP-13]|uniref:2-dehydro-3-deoxygalactonokinase n=1 Tax=Hoeflea sp. TYP-13 TaxID=3230023 RepID=UPI0034C5FBF8
MSGELFSLLAHHSILRHSISEEGEDPAAFLSAAKRAAEHPENIALKLFGLRAASLLNYPQPQVARAKLSGMIIGHEIGVARTFWSGRPVAIIGTSKLLSLYHIVLDGEGADTRLVGTKIAVLSGLAMATRQVGAAAA